MSRSAQHTSSTAERLPLLAPSDNPEVNEFAEDSGAKEEAKKDNSDDYITARPLIRRRQFAVVIGVVVTLIVLIFYYIETHKHDADGKAEDTKTTTLLAITVHNPDYDGYDNLTKYPWLGEGYGLLVEPHRVSTLRVLNEPNLDATYTWHVGTAVKASLSLDDVSPAVEKHVGVGKTEVRVALNETGVYSLVVLEAVGGVTLRSLSANLYVKYVRREVRELTLRDREEVLDAAATLWKVSTRVGRAEFGWGSAYRDIHTLAIIHNDLAGNVICDHLHGTAGYNFLTGHVALGNMFEQSMQAVNPRVHLPYWDYSKEVVNCDTDNEACFWNIWNSTMFTAEFWGGKGERGRIADGRWKDTRVPVVDGSFFEESMIEGHYRDHSYAGCYKQDSTSAGCDVMGRKEFRATQHTSGASNFSKFADKHVVNAFGLLRSPWNMNSDRYLVRSGDMCGIRNDDQWPNCMSIISQQEKFNTFSSWVLEMQFSPHGSTHLFIGGAFGECSTLFPQLKEKLSFATFHRLVSKSADLMKNMYWFGYISCPGRDACEGDEELNDEELKGGLLVANSSAHSNSNNAEGVEEEVQLESGVKEGCSCSCPSLAGLSAATVGHADFEELPMYFYLFDYLSPDMKKEVQALSPPDKLLLLATLCESNILLGDMLTSNSPLDVTFFVIHAEVERIWQRKALSGTLTSLEWPYPPGYSKWNPPCPAQCPGYMTTWMDYRFAGKANEVGKQDYSYSTSMRNDELLEHLTPSNKIYAEAIPYVYDKFKWEGCSIPRDYKGYMDQSLMNASQWIHPRELKWLQAL